MKNIVNFCKKKYKLLIPIMVAIVLFVTIFFLYREYKYDNTRNKQEVSVFQYFGGQKTEYTAIITYNLRDLIVDIKPKNVKVNYDSTPIYYEELDKIIFPKEMTIVFPLRSDSQYKLYKYAIYYNEDETHYIKNNVDLGDYQYFFLYDGQDMFFFPDEVTLNINDKEYKKLGAMSYISVVGGYTLVYYDPVTDTSEFIELEGDKVSITSEHININVTRRTFDYFGNDVILVNPNYLNPVFKTIDK